MNKLGIPAVLYIHPWEMLKIPPAYRKFRDIYDYYNVPIIDQLKFLLRNIDFCPAIDIIKDY